MRFLVREMTIVTVLSSDQLASFDLADVYEANALKKQARDARMPLPKAVRRLQAALRKARVQAAGAERKWRQGERKKASGAKLWSYLDRDDQYDEDEVGDGQFSRCISWCRSFSPDGPEPDPEVYAVKSAAMEFAEFYKSAPLGSNGLGTDLMFSVMKDRLCPMCVTGTLESGGCYRRCAEPGCTEIAHYNCQDGHPFSVCQAHKREGNTRYVEELLTLGADPNHQEPKARGQTPLMWALCFGRPNIVKKLLQAGASIDLLCPNGLPLMDLALASACEGFNEEESSEAAGLIVEAKMKSVMAAGRNLDEQDEKGRTLLQLARIVGVRKEVGRILLEAKVKSVVASGGNLDEPDETGRMLLDFARMYEHREVASFLIEAKMKSVVAAGGSLDEPIRSGYLMLETLLVTACKIGLDDSETLGLDDVVTKLLQAGASPNLPCPGSRETPLMVATYSAQPECVWALIAGEADVTIETDCWQGTHTALSFARETVEELERRFDCERERRPGILERTKRCLWLLEEADEAQQKVRDCVMVLQVSEEATSLSFHTLSGNLAAALPWPQELTGPELLGAVMKALRSSSFQPPFQPLQKRHLRLVLPSGQLLDLSPSASSLQEQLTAA